MCLEKAWRTISTPFWSMIALVEAPLWFGKAWASTPGPAYQIGGNLIGARYLEIIQPLCDICTPAHRGWHNLPAWQHLTSSSRNVMVNDYIQQNNIKWLPWPTQSHDLNPIKHLGGKLWWRLVRNHPPSTTRDKLFNSLALEWNTIPQNVLPKLACSMRKTCTECIRNGGRHSSLLSIFCEFWLYRVLRFDYI